MSIKTTKQKDIPKSAKFENDMIESLTITRARGTMLGLEMRFKSHRQPLFTDFNNTSNLGYMILVLAEVLGVGEDEDSSDVLSEFAGVPIRVADASQLGAVYSEGMYLGHFMEDKWVRAIDVNTIGTRERK